MLINTILSLSLPHPPSGKSNWIQLAFLIPWGIIGLVVLLAMLWLVLAFLARLDGQNAVRKKQSAEETFTLFDRFLFYFAPLGTVTRYQFLLNGFVLFAIKYQLDRLIAAVFHREWNVMDYMNPLLHAQMKPLSWSDPVWTEQMLFYTIMILSALPFIWIGVMFCIRRLNASGLPRWLCLLFFIPWLNILFFALLALLPEKITSPSDETAGESPLTEYFAGYLARVIPHSALGSAVLGLFISSFIGILGTVLSVTELKFYGNGLFILLPFVMGFVSVLIYGYHQPRSFWSCMAVATAVPILLCMCLMVLMVEGFLCLAMAAPVIIPLCWMGALVAYFVQAGLPRLPKHNDTMTWVLLGLVLTQPLLMGAEAKLQQEPPLVAIKTAIDVDVPPEKVWPHVVRFSQLPPPTEWYFKVGVAYPKIAVIRGEGVGAQRHCVFSTGAFIEPITIWKPPHQLAFSVASQPPPMQEWAFRPIHPPHLDDYLRSEGGQFLLSPNPNGGTHLEGTTWYRNQMWPSAYWQVWSDWIIHEIHLRVLRHVKQQAELAASENNISIDKFLN